MWFQHDGAPPHYDITTRQCLDTMFQDNWIGRGGPVHWPARSPDLTPVDFFLWGHIKAQVYATPPASLDDLKHRIHEACAQIQVTLFQQVEQSMEFRLLCLGEEGKHFEHLLS